MARTTQQPTDTMRLARLEDREHLPPLVCGFCGRDPDEAGALVAGRAAYICQDCARVAIEASEEQL